MKKLVRTLLTFALAACCALGVIACANTREAFAKPEGFAYDAATQTVTFNKVEGAESYSATVKLGETAVYENKELKDNKIDLKDKKLAVGKYDVTVSVNATADKDASEVASYSFDIEKTALAAPAELKKDGDSVTWAAVEGATAGYSLRIYIKGAGTEVLALTEVNGTTFSTAAMNEAVNAQTETITYVIAVKATATSDNLESAVSEIEWTVKGKVRKPELSVVGTDDGTTITWLGDNRATNGYKVELVKEGAVVGTYDVAAGVNSVDVDRAAALKGQQYSVRVYGAATENLRQGDVAEIAFTQTLPALESVQNVAVNNYVVTWDKLAEATNGYDVVVTRKDDKSVVKLTTTVEQSDNPSIDVSNLTYAAEKEYTVSVTAKAVDGEYAESEPATADYTSVAKWNFAEEDDKDAFASHGPSVAIENGALQLTNPVSGANVVRFVRTLKAGDKITITLNTKRIWIYGNSRKDNAAHVVKAFAENDAVPDQVGWNEENAKEGTLVLVVMKDIEGLFMDLDGANGTPVTIKSVVVESGANAFGGNAFYAGAGATAAVENGSLKMSATSSSAKLVTLVTPLIKAGSVVEITYGNITATTEGQNKTFVYGINGNYDTLILNDKSVLRRNGYTDDINNETVGGNKTENLVVDYDIYGLRFDFGAAGTAAEVKSVRIIEAKTTFDFTTADDAKWFGTDRRSAATSMALNVADNALTVKSYENNNMLIFSYPLKAGSTVTIDIASKACYAYGQRAGNNTDFAIDTDSVAETDISGERHTVTLNVNKDCVGIYLMFNGAAWGDDNASTIYGITITPPQA